MPLHRSCAPAIQAMACRESEQNMLALTWFIHGADSCQTISGLSGDVMEGLKYLRHCYSPPCAQHNLSVRQLLHA